MTCRAITTKSIAATGRLVAAVVLLDGVAQAAEIKVMSSAGTKAAYLELVPQFERASGHAVTTFNRA
jgi:molybdate transport system substrate-binding protein